MEAPVTAAARFCSEIKEKSGEFLLYYTFHVLFSGCVTVDVKIIARNSHRIFFRIDFSKIKLMSSSEIKDFCEPVHHETILKFKQSLKSTLNIDT